MGKVIGVYEIAEKAGVTTGAVTNWIRRYVDDFPKPVTELQVGKFYDSDQVEAWLRKRGKIMGAKVISFINLKGGVAKTTTTVGTATLLAGEFSKKVLVVDLDPQTNCTTMLIGEEKWKELDDEGHTLANVSGLDLIPSSLKMIDIQDRLATIPQNKFFSNNPTEIIKKAIKPIINNYDYVLIDCPPNMGLITLNGLRISDAYIIPTIPDVLSTYGIPQIISRVSEFSDNIGEDIECLGIVATKVRGQSSLHSRTLDQLKRGHDAELFDTVFYENNQMGEAAECVPLETLRQKWGYQGQFDRFYNFTCEVVKKMEG